MPTQTWTLKQMLLLATGILGPDLLAIDTLDGEALYSGRLV